MTCVRSRNNIELQAVQLPIKNNPRRQHCSCHVPLFRHGDCRSAFRLVASMWQASRTGITPESALSPRPTQLGEISVCVSNATPQIEAHREANHEGKSYEHTHTRTYSVYEGEEEEFYKLLPANKADHLCQLWQSCSDLHKIQTAYDIVDNPMCVCHSA